MDDTEIVPADDAGPEENEQDTETEQDTDDETVEEGEGPDEPEIEPELPLQQPSHKQTASQRIRQEIARRKTLEAEHNAAKAELDTYRKHLLHSVGLGQQQAPRPAQQDPAELRRKLESMDDIERIMYVQQESERRAAAERQAMQFQMAAQTDRAEFNAYLTENPEYKRFAPDVEREFQEYNNKGQPRSRDEILAIIVGREVRSKSKGAVSKASKAGAARIQQQTIKPASVRSGVASAGSKVAMSPEEILMGRLSRGEYSQY